MFYSEIEWLWCESSAIRLQVYYFFDGLAYWNFTNVLCNFDESGNVRQNEGCWMYIIISNILFHFLSLSWTPEIRSRTVNGWLGSPAVVAAVTIDVSPWGSAGNISPPPGWALREDSSPVVLYNECHQIENQ